LVDEKYNRMTFEDLEAWQQARQLVNAIYTLTRAGNLVNDFRLCSQIQAAGVSIMSNVAEGFERSHLQEKLQFYNVARGSNGEVRSLLYVISDNFPQSTKEAEALRAVTNAVEKLISGLLQSTEARKGKIRACFLFSSSHLPARSSPLSRWTTS
jgi:four helix bundle protein